MIANRGEIALRVLRGLPGAGDRDGGRILPGGRGRAPCPAGGTGGVHRPARAADSYLNQDALLTVAKATGCDGVHPGYGFLSENADFADACAAAGLTFIGPSGDAIRKAGSKSAARDLMRAAGVPRDPRLRRPGRLCGGGADRGRVRRLSCAAEGVRRRRRAGHPPVRPAGGSVRGLCGGQGRGPGLLRQ